MNVNINEMKKRDHEFVVIITKYKNNLLMVRHKDRITYENPGGHIEAGETLLEAAKRELYEETGALKFELWPVGDYSVDDRYGRLYRADISELGPLPPLEIVEVKSFDESMVWTYAEIQPKLWSIAEQHEKIRAIQMNDAKALLHLRHTLDHESDFMLYEPDERSVNLKQFQTRLSTQLSTGFGFVYDDDGFNGFALMIRKKLNRIQHIGYLVMGIKASHQGQKIGSLLLIQIIEKAKLEGIKRLELTVMADNEMAIGLYKKMGFEIEGVKHMGIYKNNEFVDEYYMYKILEA